jgi:glycosyltransferase involved in cell wall biosynthesis
MNIKHPTIGIDCRLAGKKHAGIGRYIEQLVQHVTIDPSIQWVLFVDHINQMEGVESSNNVRIIDSPVRHYTIREQRRMPGIFASEQLDLLHVPHFNVPLLYTRPFIVTIHDLLWHEQRGNHMTTLTPVMYALKHRAYTVVAARAIRKSKHILVPSNLVKEKIIEIFPDVDGQKITVTYEGVDPQWFTPSSQRELDSMSTKIFSKLKGKKVLFYTGSLYPHKNVRLIVEALKKLPDYHLLISSSRSVFVDEFLSWVEKEGMSSQVTHVGFLSDSELKAAYHLSFAFVQPSLSEGFGLPGIEAMASGVPVLASDIPIFKEVYGTHVEYFDPKNEKILILKLHSLEEKSNTAKTKAAQLYVKKFSWEHMAEETLNVYRKVLGV